MASGGIVNMLGSTSRIRANSMVPGPIHTGMPCEALGLLSGESGWVNARIPSKPVAVTTFESEHTMLDHIFLCVSDVQRSVDFYTATLAPLGITHQHDYDGKDGPPGHPDLKGFGARGRVFFWLRQGPVQGGAVHIGFVGASVAEVDAAYTAAMAAGARDNGAPGARLHYDPRYYAAGVLDPDGYSLEFVYKSWQHP